MNVLGQIVAEHDLLVGNDHVLIAEIRGTLAEYLTAAVRHGDPVQVGPRQLAPAGGLADHIVGVIDQEQLAVAADQHPAHLRALALGGQTVAEAGQARACG